MNLIDEITSRLQVLTPTALNIVDDSALHAGHKGNGGGGHFQVHITSALFDSKSLVLRHRLVYQVLADLIPHRIHALSIQASAPGESGLPH